MTTVIHLEDRPAGRRGFEIVLPSVTTGGAAAIVEGVIDAATPGPPLHVHTASDETYFVLSGSLMMHIDGRVITLTAGGLAHVSRGTAHTWATPLTEGARFLTLHLPGGYEEYHPTALRAEEEKGRPLEQYDLFKLAARFDWQMAGPEPRRLTPDGILVPAARADEEAARALAALAPVE
ncbi:cupin domain-containing protein [Streptomyces sp. NPDC059070]|uniref:cupin domain-containing protein n=1 Tax=Streptomyces sp. NPDC059070 TaxID=3346713 RepID=UPI0036AF435B